MKIVHKSWQDNNKQVRTKLATLKNSPTLTISGGLMWTILYVENASLIDWHHCGDKRFRYPVPVERSTNLGMGNTIKDLKKVALKSKTLKEKIVSIRSSSLHLPLVLFHKFFSWRRSSKSSMRWQMQMPHWLWRPLANAWMETSWMRLWLSLEQTSRWRRLEREFLPRSCRRWSLYAPVWLLPLKMLQWCFSGLSTVPLSRTMATMTLANWSFFLEAFTPKRWQSVRQNLVVTSICREPLFQIWRLETHTYSILAFWQLYTGFRQLNTGV